MARAHPPHGVVDGLPEPIRCIAISLLDDMLDQGYPRARAERSAAELAVSFAAERMWDGEQLDTRWLVWIDVACTEESTAE